MDKVLKYKFWILTGLVLPMALAGFFIAKGGVQAATDERVKTLEGVQAPNPNQPNTTHTAVAKKLADQQERDNHQQLRELDAIERRWMSWPKLILDGLEKNPATGEVVYRGTNIPQQEMSRISVLYPDEYKSEIFRVWLSSNPVVPSGLTYSEKSKNKLLFPIEKVPFHKLSLTPTIQEIWDAQEDIWILQMLFNAINTTNQAAANVNDAAIREILFLQLFGGTGESSVVATSEGAGPEGSEGYTGGSEYMTGGPGGAAGATAGASIPFATGQITYNPAEEYGSSAGTSAAGGEGSGSEYMSGGDGGIFGGGGAAAAKPLRYIEFNEDSPGPYRKRGFYLTLLIQEKRIPDFVVSLANLDPPIYAGRWNFANNPFDTDHLLKAGFANVGGSGYGGSPYGESDYGSGGDYAAGGGFGGGGFGGGFTQPTFGGEGNPYETGGGSGGADSGRLFPPTDIRFRWNPAQLAEMKTWSAARLGKDLVRLDISGYVTIFTPTVTPPEADEPASEDAAAEAVAPPEAPPTEAAPPVSEPVEPAAEPATPAEAAPAPASDAAPPPDGEAPPADTPPADGQSPPAGGAAANP